jgi:hypothetical protein
MNNNYNFIIIDDTRLNEFKKRIDIYNLKEGTTARSARPIINRSHQLLESELDISVGHQESTIDELIIESIKQLDNISDEDKQKLLSLNQEYFREATASLSHED